MGTKLELVGSRASTDLEILSTSFRRALGTENRTERTLSTAPTRCDLRPPQPARSSGLGSSFRSVVAFAALTGVAVALVLQATHWFNIRAYDGIAPVCRVDTSERVVALTFDDGPDPEHTGQILDLLLAESAHATFFVIGQRALEHPRLIAEIAGSDNELANHTWSHPDLTTLSPETALTEIVRGSLALADHRPAPLVRAPYGEIGPSTLGAIDELGLTAVHWSLPLDAYVSKIEGGAPEIAAAIVADLSPGEIILAHDADDGGISRDEAVAALSALLPMLKTEGYQVVTASALLEGRVPVRASPRPWFWQSGFHCPG